VLLDLPFDTDVTEPLNDEVDAASTTESRQHQEAGDAIHPPIRNDALLLLNQRTATLSDRQLPIRAGANGFTADRSPNVGSVITNTSLLPVGPLVTPVTTLPASPPAEEAPPLDAGGSAAVNGPSAGIAENEGHEGDRRIYHHAVNEALVVPLASAAVVGVVPG
jgi:hypothetical protein